MHGLQHQFHKTSLKIGLRGQFGQPRANHDLGVFLDKTSNINFVQNVNLNMIKVFWKTMCTYMNWSHYYHSYQVTQAIQSYMVYIR